MAYMVLPIRTIVPGVMKFTKLVDRSLVIITIHYYTLSLSDLCLGIEKNNAFSLYNLYAYAPALGVMKFIILEDPSLVIITTHLVCLNHASK